MHLVRNDIQGMRAIAVLAVVIFHAFPKVLTGGFIGVDIFFVISGFLITGSIMKDIDKGRFSIAEFYRRRIRRLFPALSVMILVCLSVGFFQMSPVEYVGMARSTVAAMLFVSNIYFQRTTDYFAGAAETQPFLHTWSLSVEEQFYIVFPVFLFSLMRWSRPRGWVWMVALTVAFAVLSQAIVVLRPEWGYFFTPARVFELLIGASVSLLAPRIAMGRRVAETMAALGLVMVVVPLILVDQTTPFPGLTAAVPCLGTGLMIWSGVTTRTTVGEMIAVQPFRYIGDISYSLYLWHWPLLAFPRLALGVDLEPTVAGIAVVGGIVISAASHRWIERPFIRGDYPRLPYLTVGGAVIVAVCAVAVGVFMAKGVPGRFPAEARLLLEGAKDFSPRRQACHQNQVRERPWAYDRNCILGADGVTPDMVVWGDSHGVELAYALARSIAPSGHALRQITASACPPAPGFVRADRPGCGARNRETLTAILADSQARTVILAAYFHNPLYADRVGLERGFEEVVATLTSAGRRVVIVLPIPTFDFDVPDRLAKVRARGGDLGRVGLSRAAFEAVASPSRRLLSAIAERHGALLVDPTSDLCDTEVCHAHDATRGVLYFNRDHLGLAGVTPVAEAVARLTTAAPPPR